MNPEQHFTFQISLTVLDHLGRNLYRSSSTVLGEAISNAWDADATNVHIYLDKDAGTLVVKDDGIGMNANDFQNRFLKIGFSKRKDGGNKSAKGRPYIGRKGIGKLALLSCADRITVASKQSGKDYVGGTIDNGNLDNAITSDLEASEYGLETLNENDFSKYTEGHDNGTIIILEGFKGGIRNSEGYLRKLIALYFKFALVDPDFVIFLNGNKISEVDLQDLADSTEFLWRINVFKDPYIDKGMQNLKEEKAVTMKIAVRGFIASVRKPSNLTIANADERVSVDLFVNGRVRERNILKHIPTARVAESYFYGQIHFDGLEGDVDRFTSSREGVVADDPEFNSFLSNLRKLVLAIVDDWDTLRRDYREEGDSENLSVPPRVRKSEELVNTVAEDYELPTGCHAKLTVDGWVKDLHNDASHNVSSYAECFVSENLIRKYIEHKQLPHSTEAETEATRWKRIESENKNKGNISIDIRANDGTLSYLSMDDLANMIDKTRQPLVESALSRDAREYKPIRDACAHTALLTATAKLRLSAVYENIKGRLRTLLEAI